MKHVTAACLFAVLSNRLFSLFIMIEKLGHQTNKIYNESTKQNNNKLENNNRATLQTEMEFTLYEWGKFKL